MKPLLHGFALLAFAVVGCDQGGEVVDREAGKEEKRLTLPNPAEKLYEEAVALYEKGKFLEAKVMATQAYSAFERLPVKDKATRVKYLTTLCEMSDALQENDNTIAYANELLIYGERFDAKANANSLLGSAYRKKGDPDKAIRYFEKAFESNPIDPFLYHFMLNTSEISLEYAAGVIIYAARQMDEQGLLAAEHEALESEEPLTVPGSSD